MGEPDWDALGRIGDAPEPEDERDALQARVEELRSALAELTEAVGDKLATMDYYFGPNARTATSGESRAAFSRIDAAVEAAREALAAVPEGPEPRYEWRMAVRSDDDRERIVWAMPISGLATMDRICRAARELADSADVEWRTPGTAPGEWERVEEGTER
jgi:hypothetical protein